MPRILIVDDEAGFRQLYSQVLTQAELDTDSAGSAEEALAFLKHTTPDMIISDVRMPGEDGISLLRQVREMHGDLPFLLVTAHSDVRDAVAALKLGAVDYLAKPVDLDELVAAVKDALGIGHSAPDSDVPEVLLEGLVVESDAIRQLLQDACRVAASDATILLTGESGVGKGALSEFIHRASARANEKMVSVNCAAIPEQLIASELFGHVKGAFTGATANRRGRFREAHRGTLLLDEIGELPLTLQPTLLRVLESRQVIAVGSDREQEVDYRLIAATNRDLEEAVAEGRFRQDLFYRLNVINLNVPPLRERVADILPLAKTFLAEGDGVAPRLSPEASRLLEAHDWPGNVRELHNAMERARLLSRSDIILPEHLPPAVREASPAPVTAAPAPAGSLEQAKAPMQTLRETEIDQVRRALEHTGGNRTHAAKLLGITRRGLINKIKRFDLAE